MRGISKIIERKNKEAYEEASKTRVKTKK